MKRKIIGVTVGSPLPKPNLMQTDPTKGDYIKGKEEFLEQVNGNGSGGNNLADVIRYTEQTLTEEQKAQARANIGAAADGEVGTDSFSPIATVEQTNTGAVISITDKDGTTTVTITHGKDGADGQPGEKGDKGDPGEKGEKGEKGADGTGVTILGSFDTEEELKAAHPTSSVGDSYLVGGYLYVWSATANDWENVGNIQGPQGEKGADGAKGDKGDKGDTGDTGAAGKNGTSATHSWNGTTLTVTSASGTSSANLKGDKGDKGDTGLKGDKGDKGDTGATGYSPVRGTDYWTDNDIAQIKSYVDDAILGGAW